MDHVAILRKSNFKKGDSILSDILSGRKTIESRWYRNKIAPWDKIFQGDTVYFKESGCPVTAKARVSKVLQFGDLDPVKIKEIITRYGNRIAPNLPEDEFILWTRNHPSMRYCLLIFLEDVTNIPTFSINKTGFGSACAWMVIGDIERVRLKADA